MSANEYDISAEEFEEETEGDTFDSVDEGDDDPTISAEEFERQTPGDTFDDVRERASELGEQARDTASQVAERGREVASTARGAVDRAVENFTGESQQSAGSQQTAEESTSQQQAAQQQTQQGVETLRDTGRTSAEASVQAGVETLRQTGTPSGERRPEPDSTVTARDIQRAARPGSEPLIEADDVRRAGGNLAATGGATARGVRQTARRVDQGITERVGPGSPAAERARETVDVAVDTAFQDSEEVAPAFGLEGRRAAEDDVTLSGPSVDPDPQDPTELLESGERGTLNRQVTESLTREGGVLSEEQEDTLRSAAEDFRSQFRQGQEFQQDVADATGSETAGGFARGTVNAGVDLLSLPASGPVAAESAIEVAQNTPRTAQQFGTGETAGAALETGGRATEQLTDFADENPGRFAGNIAGGVVAGSAVVRGASRGATAFRNTRVRQQADATVDLEDLTTERAVEEGELPEFETSTNAPTSEAVREVRQRAEDAPEAVQESVGTDRVLFRSESERLPEELEAERGNFELPGLFTSPDLSPLRLSVSSERSLSRPRLPRPSDFTGRRPERTSAFQGDRVEGAPRSAAQSGRIEGPDGEPRPDPSTSGSQFLENQAERGTAFVRPTGDRTTELEAIFPPGSQFRRQGQLAVNLPNRRVATLDIFRRTEADDVATGTRRAEDVDVGDDVVDASDIRRVERRSRNPDGEPVTPPVSVGSGGRNRTSTFREDRTVGRGVNGSTTPPTPAGSSGSGGFTEPPSSPPNSPPVESFAEIGSQPATDPPGSPPRSPPDSPRGSIGSGSSLPPSQPPSSPPTSPPSGGESIPESPFITPPSSDSNNRRRRQLDLDADERDSGRRFDTFDREFQNPVGDLDAVDSDPVAEGESDIEETPFR